MPTVAESLVATLAAAGVKRIYGIVGDSLNGITNELGREKTIEWVHVRRNAPGAVDQTSWSQPTAVSVRP